MRTYRLEIRLIQVAVGLALMVLITGFFGLWGEAEPVPTGKSGTDKTPVTSEEPLSNTKIVALGDSFTLGYPLDPKYSWVQHTEDVLEVTVVNKGKTYQTAKDLLDRFDTDVIAENPGRVIIFSGIGDALQEVPVENVKTNIMAIVEKAKSNHIIPVLALPIGYPGYRDTIQEIREWETGYAQEQKILMLDFATVLFNSEGEYLDGLTIDGKYPNAKGYKAMGDYTARILK